jgi:eukaryotic-like serine/threonine-protein kinase
MIPPESQQRVKEILSGALDRPTAERPAFLDEACGGDVDLRRQVERLLAALQQAPDFLESPPRTEVPTEELSEEGHGRLVGE